MEDVGDGGNGADADGFGDGDGFDEDGGVNGTGNDTWTSTITSTMITIRGLLVVMVRMVWDDDLRRRCHGDHPYDNHQSSVAIIIIIIVIIDAEGASLYRGLNN